MKRDTRCTDTLNLKLSMICWRACTNKPILEVHHARSNSTCAEILALLWINVVIQYRYFLRLNKCVDCKDETNGILHV